MAGFTARATQRELVRADRMLQEFAQRARREARLGEPIPFTEEMYTKLHETIKEYPSVCTKPHIKSVSAYQIVADDKDWEAMAIKGRGLCYCTMDGNCRLWVYRNKKGKLEKVFDTKEASAFGFLASRAGIPLLIVWTRESAVEQFAIVYKMDYGEYIEAANWKEVYEYEDEDEEFRVHDTPKIYSNMPLGVFLPD